MGVRDALGIGGDGCGPVASRTQELMSSPRAGVAIGVQGTLRGVDLGDLIDHLDDEILYGGPRRATKDNPVIDGTQEGSSSGFPSPRARLANHNT